MTHEIFNEAAHRSELTMNILTTSFIVVGSLTVFILISLKVIDVIVQACKKKLTKV